jgi:hypothetical protein
MAQRWTSPPCALSASCRDGHSAGVKDWKAKAAAKDIGLTRKNVHKAGTFRHAKIADPGVTK